MGSRGRSIRLRIYFLVAIPLITMLGLFGYVAYTSVTNWLNLDRAPTLIDETSEPLTNFVNVMQAERRAAVVYLSQPNAANLSSFQSAVNVTKSGAVTVDAALTSPATKSASTPAETAAINTMIGQIAGMAALRAEVSAEKLAPLGALEAYTNIIAGQGAVLQSEANSIQDSAPVLQGLGLISAVNTQEDVSEQDAVLASALVSGKLTQADRVAFSNAGGRLQDDTMTYQELLTPAELKTYDDTLNQLAPQSIQTDLTEIQQAVPAGVSLSAMERQGLSPQSWQLLTSTWLKAASKAGTTTATAVLAANTQPSIAAKQRVLVLAAVGAIGLILTLLITILLGRSINRRLTVLRRSALTLAHEQLPSVVARLRRGESVDVAAEAPPLRVGADEIGQVGQAIDIVRQTAIRSAVEEAKVRQGVNDMFRNLARRNQSLLQRQLTVIDDMERKATDPDVLEDLFKMDHLTTRMRRHAEGLIILSGAPPGRSWSAPVKLIDVMRGAVAEVEDYARVSVSTQSRAALAGSAVTDVIHLLAELIENATTLSPPFTQVRVGGETVANGFAIEIEDRGLGMTPQRLEELNERLANPPDINPANTEQLGLFVVGQLARRHGISVTLRPSPYGGTTAVALIPRGLIVEEGPAAITAGSGLAGANGRPTAYQGAGAFGGNAGGADRTGAGRQNGTGAVILPPTPAVGNDWSGLGEWPGSGAWPEQSGWPASDGWAGSDPNGAAYAGPGPSGFPPSGPPMSGPAPAGHAMPGADYPSPPVTPPAAYDEPATSPIRIAGALRHPGTTPTGAGSTGASEPGSRRGGRHESEDVPVVTGVPVSRPTAPPASAFDVFTPIRRPEQDGIPPATPATPATLASPADAPYARPYPDFGGSPADSGYENFYDRGDGGNSGPGDDGYQSGDSGVGEDYKGLPRRVRQANLAPQLRASNAASAPGPAGVPPATAASLTDMRNTLSAMQRGWQQGRSQSQQDTEDRTDGE
jgi:signal transduction histidine kinase